ncbi:hypothetical protein PSV08DRAFT_355069 [Bipolaris maydis]|uniref:uncharacterized protein n=1 Tax=Cochliobolus heterostrophus TaxID=5016 RepID=UPI0024D35416|nr:hypothetical protein PSV08DRAFT_355069 [Bipolaris maydis]
MACKYNAPGDYRSDRAYDVLRSCGICHESVGGHQFRSAQHLRLVFDSDSAPDAPLDQEI